MSLMPITQPVAAALVVLALWMLGLTQLNSSLLLYGIQSAILGGMAAWIGYERGDLVVIPLGIAVLILKGIVVPIYLSRAARRIGCRHESALALAPPLQLFVAIAAVAFLELLHPFRGELPATALPPLEILLAGMLLMVTRRLAVSQIVGFLVLENGIFLFTVTQAHPMPVIVEIGVLMDVLAGTMLAGLLTFRISRTFEHIDVTKLRQLRG